MIEIGKINNLTILRETTVGLYLGDDERNDVLLPNSFIKEEHKVGDKLDVFIYNDSEDRIIATTKNPYVKINEFAYLRVVSVSEVGAFLDWGLEKDLLVPYSEQKHKMSEDNFYVVYVYLDEVTNRIVASNKIDKFLDNETIQLTEGEPVDLIIYEESPLGFSCIINGAHKGLIYHNDIFKEVFIGDEMEGFVKTIREDKLIDISFQKSGFKNVLDSTEVVMEYLQKNNGFLNLHDKSTPEEISIRLSMSKATFKKAIGILYRHRKVLIKPDGVYLVKEETPKEEPKDAEAE
ncbi:MAG: S1-like domain-containing RNA-binding protein [Bacteroidota bacterium]|nr:S1-like domain-containing RNA-binding protein [Bacteroidota bacterium]MDP3145101.1 S1-like domain-containing RNA-binding protein [Bacteroidota bacterium]